MKPQSNLHLGKKRLFSETFYRVFLWKEFTPKVGFTKTVTEYEIEYGDNYMIKLWVGIGRKSITDGIISPHIDVVETEFFYVPERRKRFLVYQDLYITIHIWVEPLSENNTFVAFEFRDTDSGDLYDDIGEMIYWGDDSDSPLLSMND